MQDAEGLASRIVASIVPNLDLFVPARSDAERTMRVLREISREKQMPTTAERLLALALFRGSQGGKATRHSLGMRSPCGEELSQQLTDLDAQFASPEKTIRLATPPQSELRHSRPSKVDREALTPSSKSSLGLRNFSPFSDAISTPQSGLVVSGHRDADSHETADDLTTPNSATSTSRVFEDGKSRHTREHSHRAVRRLNLRVVGCKTDDPSSFGLSPIVLRRQEFATALAAGGTSH